VYVIQHTQREMPNKHTPSKEKTKRGHVDESMKIAKIGNMYIKQYENVKHERHTRQ